MNTIRPEINLVSAIILFGIFQCGILLHFFLRKRAIKANIYIILFLIVLITLQAESFLSRSGYMIFTLPLLSISVPLLLLIGPLLLHHTQVALGKTRRLGYYFHYLPFLCYFIYSFFFFVQPTAVKYNAYIRSFHPDLSFVPASTTIPIDPLNIQGFVVVEGIVIHLLVYASFGFYIILQYKRTLGKKKILPWLILVNGMELLAGLILFLSEGGILNGKVFFKAPLPFNAASIMPSIFVYAISIFLMKDSSFFKISDGKYQKSVLSESLQAKYFNKINHLLETEKLFLNNRFYTE